jgi:hypothetical protein
MARRAYCGRAKLRQMWRTVGLWRNFVALVCMGLSLFLSSQTALAVAHQIEHFHHHAHSHTLLAGDILGDVIYLSHDELSAPDAHSETAGLPESGLSLSVNHHAPDPVDHQHGAGSLIFLVSQYQALITLDLATLRCEFIPQSSDSFSPSGPDHPPKAGFEIRV